MGTNELIRCPKCKGDGIERGLERWGDEMWRYDNCKGYFVPKIEIMDTADFDCTKCHGKKTITLSDNARRLYAVKR